ncbi:uncharacterized protein FIESC28_06946 [Fusarium coffeatum]|uniref:Uncharacterized protein n=1 Tax=Fusarium coffeatum TaxID=231269 RepID=A0A366RHF7_9HYPO|nr:uncharacterized protein FIESC28_06946 [Fusarium coffeatum]RBR16537.1 hypothetical protein FIESC28_06946 [Fusarium coffeatum]
MTTNSFGGALPRFDFPSQPQPAISRMARVNKALPVVLMAASVAALAVKTRQNLDAAPVTTSMLFARPQNLMPQGQAIMDKRNGDVGLKPNK